MNFKSLVQAIYDTHGHFQAQAFRAVNVSLTLRNWVIGYYISTYELEGSDRAAYGERLLELLAQLLIARLSWLLFADYIDQLYVLPHYLRQIGAEPAVAGPPAFPKTIHPRLVSHP